MPQPPRGTTAREQQHAQPTRTHEEQQQQPSSRTPQSGVTEAQAAHWHDWVNHQLEAAGWAVHNPRFGWRYYPEAWDAAADEAHIDLKWHTVRQWARYGKLPYPEKAVALANFLGLHPASVLVSACLMSPKDYAQVFGLHAGRLMTRSALETHLATLVPELPADYREAMRDQWVHEYQVCQEVQQTLEMDDATFARFVASLDSTWAAERVRREVYRDQRPQSGTSYAQEALSDFLSETGAGGDISFTQAPSSQDPGPQKPRRRPSAGEVWPGRDSEG